MSTWRGAYVYRGSRALVELNAAILARRPDPRVPVYGVTGRHAEAPCGTVAANRRHRRRGEPVCEACREAERLRHQLRKEARRAA